MPTPIAQDSNRSGRGIQIVGALTELLGIILGAYWGILIAIWVHLKAFQENFSIILGAFLEHFENI